MDSLSMENTSTGEMTMTKYTFQLTPEMLEVIKAVAEAQDRSVSQLIRVALKNYLASLKTAS